MKKEFLKKIAVFSLIGAMIIPTLAFASDTTDTTKAIPADKPAAERPARGDMKARPEGDRNFMPRNGEREVPLGDRSFELVTLYAPDLLDSFIATTDLQASIRDSINALQKSKIEAKQVDYRALLETIKENLQAGTLTREEAQDQLDAFKEDSKTDRSALNTELDELKTTYDVDFETTKTLMTALQTAIENEDEASIRTCLETMLTQLQKRVEYDQARYDLLSQE